MTPRLVLVGSLIFSAAAGAQVIGPLVRVNATQQAGVHYSETAIAVNPNNANQFVAMSNVGSDFAGGPDGVYVATTSNGAANFDNRGIIGQTILPLPTCAVSPNLRDPIAAASWTTGRIWFGAVGVSQGGGLFLTNLDPSTNTLSSMVSVFCVQEGVFLNPDKPSLAVGPRTDSIGEAVFASFEAVDLASGCPGIHPLWSKRSVAAPSHTPGISWADPHFPIYETAATPPPPPPTPECGDQGIGVGTVVIQGGAPPGSSGFVVQQSDRRAHQLRPPARRIL